MWHTTEYISYFEVKQMNIIFISNEIYLICESKNIDFLLDSYIRRFEVLYTILFTSEFVNQRTCIYRYKPFIHIVHNEVVV